MRPPTVQEVASAVKALCAHAKACRIDVESATDLHAVWSMHCRDMPATLLATGLAEVLKHWTNTFCLPAPGAVWDQIEAPLAQMRRDLSAMERAYAMTAEADSPDAEDRAPSAETDKVIAETLAILRAAGGRRIW